MIGTVTTVSQSLTDVAMWLSAGECFYVRLSEWKWRDKMGQGQCDRVVTSWISFVLYGFFCQVASQL